MSDAKARHFKPHSRFPFVTSICRCLNNSARERRKAHTPPNVAALHRCPALDHHGYSRSPSSSPASPTATPSAAYHHPPSSLGFRYTDHHTGDHPPSSFGPRRAAIGLARVPPFIPHSFEKDGSPSSSSSSFTSHCRCATPQPRDLDNATPASGCHRQTPDREVTTN